MRELDFARALAREAGAVIVATARDALDVQTKEWADLVTTADRAAERLIRERLSATYPADALYGEEEGRGQNDQSSRTWIIDPLDGTANFAGGMNIYAVCITLVESGLVRLNVTYDPLRDEMFDASAGGGAHLNGLPMRVADDCAIENALVHLAFARDRRHWRRSVALATRITEIAPHARNLGSSALAQAYVAAGRLHAHVRVNVGDFDILGGNLLIAEAGGVATALDGTPYGDGARGLLAAGPRIHAVLNSLGLASCLDSE